MNGEMYVEAHQTKSCYKIFSLYFHCPTSIMIVLSEQPPPHTLPPLTFTGHAVLAGAEENQQSQLGADETFAGAQRCGKNQVGHGVGCSVDPPQASTAQALSTCDGLQTLQPDIQHTALTLHRTDCCFFSVAAVFWFFIHSSYASERVLVVLHRTVKTWN